MIKTLYRIVMVAGCSVSYLIATDKVLIENLRLAIAKGDISTTQTLIHQKGDVNVKAKGSWTPLMSAAMRGKKDWLAELLKHPDIKVNAKDDDGMTALMSAASWGEVQCLQTLLGCDTIEINTKDNKGRTALIVAFESDDCSELCIQALIADCRTNVNVQIGAAATSRDGSGWKMVHEAAAMGNVRLLQEQIDSKKSHIYALTDSDYTPLMLATYFGQDACVRVLLEDPEFDVHYHSQGAKAVDIAQRYGHTGIQLLLQDFIHDDHEKAGASAL